MICLNNTAPKPYKGITVIINSLRNTTLPYKSQLLKQARSHSTKLQTNERPQLEMLMAM